MGTDKVIEALRVCGNVDLPCGMCPYYDRGNDYLCLTMKLDALELIQKQQAEIDRLKQYEKIWHDLTDRVQVVSSEELRIIVSRSEEGMNDGN